MYLRPLIFLTILAGIHLASAGSPASPPAGATTPPAVPRAAIVSQVVKDFGISPALLEREPWSWILEQDNWYHRSRVMDWPAFDSAATRTVAPASGGRADFACDGRNDEIEIQQAIDSLPAGGGKVVLLPGTFVLGNCIRPRDNTELEIRGTLSVADAVQSELTADVPAGATTISVADASRFRVGQWVTVIDNDPRKRHKGGRKYGESVTVQSIRGNTLTVSAPLGVRYAKSRLQVDGYAVAKKAFVTSSHSAILVLSKRRVYIHGGDKPGKIYGNKGGQPPTAPLATDEDVEDLRVNCGISIVDSAWVKVENLHVHDANLHNIALYRSEDCEVAGVDAAGSNDKNICVLRMNKVRLIDNYCHDSVMEDGICCHWPVGAYILIARNRTTGNPRSGIHVGHLGPHPLLVRNVSFSNTYDIHVNVEPGSGIDVRSQLRTKPGLLSELKEKGCLLIDNSIGEAVKTRTPPPKNWSN